MACYLSRLRQPGSLSSLLKENRPRPPQKIVVDYSSPNVAKHFHIGNLRSTLIGRYVDKIHRSLGDNVFSVNYLGDWGTQFAMIASYWDQMRPSDVFWTSCSDEDKIRSLTDCYVVANKKSKEDEEFREVVRSTFEQMEMDIKSNNLDSPALRLWCDISTVSRRHLQAFYQLLDIHFDHWFCESAHVAKASELAESLLSQGIARKSSEGLYLVDFNEKEYGIVRKSDATTLYLSRELASILARDHLFSADRYLYVVDRAQRRHFEALRILLERIGRSDLAAKVEHVSYGRVKGLSTRMGRTESVRDVLQRGNELAKQFMMNSKTLRIEQDKLDEVASSLSLSTVVFSDLKRARNSEYEFSFHNAFALNQNNALLLQMKHSRLCSIEERNSALLPELVNCQSLPNGSDDVTKLIQLLQDVEKIVSGSADKLEACQLTVYLIQLAKSVGTVSAQLKVQGQPKEIAVPRLLLLSSARHVLAQGMALIGVAPVDAM